MILKKQYLKTKPICKVTFGIPSEVTFNAQTAHLVGEFNGWDITATPMKKLKDGSFTVTMDLETGRAYQFRYLVDRTQWENAWNADRYMPTPFGDSTNSVIVL
ncbi:MAG: isoamylase early set domain-containing protein [Deltaproteobacteria bacterium]|nr:isoamylase early set domain-containing protein [Deltaproteobacteria bacterium]